MTFQDMPPKAGHPLSWFSLLAYAFIPLAVARLYGMIAGAAFTGLATLAAFRGFVSDLLVALVITLIFGLPVAYVSRHAASHRLARPAGFFIWSIWAIWVLAVSANVEHIMANGANINLVFSHLALNNEFIMGSVFSVKTLISLMVVLAVSAPLCIYLSRLKPVKAISAGAAAAAAMILTLTLAALPVKNDLSYWLQMNLAEENIRYIIRQTPPARMQAPNLGEFYKADISGKKIINYPQKKYNVLLVLMESLNHGLLEKGWIPNVESIHDRNVSFTQYATLQSQTNRGLYALLCGDYPNFLFSEAKSDYVALYGPVKKCLPEILGTAGYNTAFMQGAVLSYMQKDRFAKSAGFAEAYGSESFDSYLQKNAWGVDDKTLFHYARAKIAEMAKMKKPWFMTALTLSTHHPFNVPGVRNPTARQAYRFADTAFGEFMRSLDSDGLLDNTIVIITTDEGKSGGASVDLLSEVEKNHAVMTVMLPGSRKAITQEDLFTQSDILISVLDYLGLPIPGDAFGRSIFRQYGKGREVIFASSIASKIFNYSSGSSGSSGTTGSLLTVCNMDLNCSSYKNNNNRLFGGEFTQVEVEQHKRDRLRSFIGHNELSFQGHSGNTVYYRGLKNYKGDRYLVGDHKISLKKGDRITWRLKISTGGTIGVRLAVQDIRPLANGQVDLRPFMETRKWVTGEAYVLEKTYTAEEDIATLATNITVSDERNAGYLLDYISIDVRRAR